MILESGTPADGGTPEPTAKDWRDAIRNAQTFGDIAAVFESEFPAQIIMDNLITEDAKTQDNSRADIRTFLESLDAKAIRSLKLTSKSEYLTILKSIVRKLFPKGANLKFRKDGQIIDYDHFLKDSGISKYIHTLPETLKRENIKIELSEEDKVKEYFIKKYFDTDIQKDVWDIVVIHDGEVRTKIARSGRKGGGYVETLLLKDRAGNEASRSASPEGVTENASTLSEYGLNIKSPNDDVNKILESIDTEAHKSASSPKNDIPYPTPAQIEAGNYTKGHVSIQGLDITIENPKGSTRRGVSKDGNAWESIIHHHYGYIKGTIGRDKDHIDVFIGDKTESPHVYVVNQVDPATGSFDEHKVMLGFESRADASDAYYANYEKGWKGMGSMTTQSMVDFKDWLENGNTKMILESTVQPNQKPTIAQDQSKRAMKNTLDTQKNTMQGASRPDIGWIAFLWGSAGTAPLFADGDGLARIIAKQDFEKKYLPSEQSGHELCMRLVDMLTRGFIKRKYGPTSRPKVDLSWQGEIATVSWDPDRKTWYLAAWREDWGGILESAGQSNDNPVFRDWRYNFEHSNSGVIIPNRPGQKFSADQIGILVDWAEEMGLHVTKSAETQVRVVDESANNLDLTLYGAEGVKRETAGAKHAKAKDDKEEKAKALKAKADGRASSEWILNTFNDASINDYNRDALSDFLEGISKAYNGAVNADWVDGIDRLSARTDGGKNIDWKKLKSAYEKQTASTAIDVDGLRVVVSIDNNQAKDIPPGWIVFNAPRPMYGDKEWQGDPGHGMFYGAVDPQGDGAEWMVKDNKALDGWIYQDISAATMTAMVRQNYLDGYFKNDAAKVDAAMAKIGIDQIRGQFFNVLEKMNYGAFKSLLAKATAQPKPDASDTSAPSVAITEQWRLDIRNAKTFQDIAGVFNREFGVTVEDD